MPRRIYTYDAGRGWELWNLISSVGVAVPDRGLLFFVGNLVRSLRRGEPAGDDPWDAWTLEWSTTSPPPRLQLRDSSGGAQPPAAVGSEASGGSRLEVRDEHAADHRQQAAATMTDRSRMDAAVARPRRDASPHPHRVGAVHDLRHRVPLLHRQEPERAVPAGGPRPADPRHDRLLSSSISVTLAVRALRRGRMAAFNLWWLVTIVLGAFFLVATGDRMDGADLRAQPDDLDEPVRHDLLLAGRLPRRPRHRRPHAARAGADSQPARLGAPAHAERVEMLSWYWHFVDAVWVVVFTIVYVIGR